MIGHPRSVGAANRTAIQCRRQLPDVQRSSGILLHPTSLPGPFPVGDLGATAHEWVDWLASAGVTWWQTLPINPPGFGGSPYQALSAFAGSPFLIAPEFLLADGLIDSIPPCDADPSRVDFEIATVWKRRLLADAGRRLHDSSRVNDFRHRNADWLEDYALFTAIRDTQNGRSLFDWPEGLRRRTSPALADAKAHLEPAIDQVVVEQFLFHDHWTRLRRHAANRGIRLIGDVPIFVAVDSADFWAHPGLFDIDAEGRPLTVAGVPPDYFAATGQLWGNPQYQWSAHAEDDFGWWTDRLRHLLGLVDLVRIDHFRAFADYWEIPAGSLTAETGRWVLGPGRPFFDTLERELGPLPLIAEDLGEVHQIVSRLRDDVGLPGMGVAQFSFSPPAEQPTKWDQHLIGYTGTHDNDTAVGWWATASQMERERATNLEGVNQSTVAADLLQAVWRSPARIAMAPIQDVLALGSEARMNLPGTVGPHNWTWRLDALPTLDDAKRIAALNSATRRTQL
jgi:4-alpha-glucanotransferase